MTTRDIKAAVNLEARLAALFVQTAGKFACKLHLKRGNMEVNCKSIMGIVSMCVREGEMLTITATGPDENEGLTALTKMLAEG